jgi:glycosyltransferase involved in cell wall biosynthesis
MSLQLSIIIICKNEAAHIARTLDSVCSLSNDVVVYDSGSTDGTLDIVSQYPVNLHTGPWEGFGPTRQKAVELSRYNWVLIIDGDEVVSKELAQEIRSLDPHSEQQAWRLPLHNYLGRDYIRRGDWGNDYRLRLYNKKVLRWNGYIVHEKLVVPPGVKITDLHYPVYHCTAQDVDELSTKMVEYALLTAEQYYINGRQSTWIKRHMGPVFTFVKNYIFLLGFLDGRNGYVIARIISFYTFLKYTRLHELWIQRRQPTSAR